MTCVAQKIKNTTIVNPVMPDGTERLQDLLLLFFDKFVGRPTLYIIDDCSATKELTKKKDMLSQRAISCVGYFPKIYFCLEGPPGAGKVAKACNGRNASSHLMQSEIIIYGLARKCVKLSPFSLTIFILDLALNYIDKL